MSEQASEEAKRVQGKVKFFNRNKGYGFIDVPDQEKGIFFHYSDVLEDRDLEENDEVEFEMGEGPKGPKAINVKRVEEKEEIEEEGK